MDQFKIIVTITKPYLHILKKNRGYIGVCSESAVNEKSYKTVKLEIEKPAIIKNDLEEDYFDFEIKYKTFREEYIRYCCYRRLDNKNYEFNYAAYEKYVTEKKEDAIMCGRSFDRLSITEKEKEQFKIYKPIIYNEPIDEYMKELEGVFLKLTEKRRDYDLAIKRANMINNERYINNYEKNMSIVAERILSDFMIEKNALPPYPDVYCQKCSKYISYKNWSTHTQSSSHMNFNEKKSTHMVCGCGSKFLKKNLKNHETSDKHKRYLEKL